LTNLPVVSKILGESSVISPPVDDSWLFKC